MQERTQLIERLSAFKNILVCGPQRSGTTFMGNELARHLDRPYFTEEAFGVHHVEAFFQLLRTEPAKVIQAPAVTHVLDQIPNKQETIIVWMNRDVDEILRSEKRINWPEAGVEKAKYLRRLTHPSMSGKFDDLDYRQPISCIKYTFWRTYQRSLLPHQVEIPYDRLSDLFPERWLQAADRSQFHSRQINGDPERIHLSPKVNFAKLYVDVGEGFSEQHVLSLPVRKNTTDYSFSLSPDRFSTINGLRLDPVEQPVAVNVQDIRWEGSKDPLPIIRSNALYQDQNLYFFGTSDPQCFIDPGREVPKKTRKLCVRVQIEQVGDAVFPELAMLLQKNKANQKEVCQQLTDYQHKVLEYESRVNRSDRQIRELQQGLEAYALENQQMEARSIGQDRVIKRQRERLARLDRRLQEITRTRQQLQKRQTDWMEERKAIRQSTSYRVGRLITWPFRSVYDLFS